MRNLIIPKEAENAILSGAVMAVSVSGGKDSQALLKAVITYHRANKLPNKIFAIHADLGRAEWKQTPAYIESLCNDLNIELVIVRAMHEGKEIDLLDRIQRRATQLEEQGKDSPPFPSAMARYCTSDMKTKPINDYLRRFTNVISIEGVCWHESPARAKKPVFQVREGIATRGRLAFTWNAIIDWSLEEVWGAFGQNVQSHQQAVEIYEKTGTIPAWWNYHPAYAMGNSRLSCAICILGSKSDYLNGIKHNSEYAAEINLIELKSGYAMKQGLSIAAAKSILNQTKI